MEVVERGGGGEEEEAEKKVGLGFPMWVAVRRRFGLDDPFFAAGNIERELLAKQVALDLTGDERYEIYKLEDAETYTVCCPIVGCGLRLNCLEDFEDHYRARHTASCSVCSRVFPTSRLLSIHISEAHDSFFQAKVARGFPMYECLVEGCGMKLKSYKSRQQHLIDKHKFPSSFEFYKKAHPSKQHRQKHQRKQAASAKDTGMDVDGKASMQPRQKYRPKQADPKEEINDEAMEVEEKMDDLVSAVSRLTTTSDSSPSSISFGHRHARGFSFLPRSLRQSTKQASEPRPKR